MLRHPASRSARCLISASRPVLRSPNLPRPTTNPRSLLTPRSLRSAHSSQFQPFVPPSPASLGRARPARHYPRTSRWVRRLLYTSAALGTLYLVDVNLYASSLTRSLRTFGLGLLVAIDYKLNFRASPLCGGTIADLHRRSAERLFDLLRSNGGLYLKIGQAIAMQSAIMPPEFQKMFARMFDDAPQNDWEDVERVIREDFGKSPEEVFGVSFRGEEGKGVMEKVARASASVAQVHWARLPDGREVAIKVQKREIAQQVGWDLWAFKVMMKTYTYWFDLPMYSLVPYISSRLLLECDFEVEATNAQQMTALIAAEPRLRGRVYIPTVYPELSTKRVMTAEWIEGVRLWDKPAITSPWRGPSTGSPGVTTPLSSSPTTIYPPNPNSPRPSASSPIPSLKPDRTTTLLGPRSNSGLGLSLKEVMTTMLDLFSAQTFLWGLVHCDPHPGNILLRRLPSGNAQLVLLDHGLYVALEPGFRVQYAKFWRALLAFDNDTLKSITAEWGVKQPDLFASATLMKPYTGGDQSTARALTKSLEGATPGERHFAAQNRMRAGIRAVLSDETKWPRELIFLARNMRIVQGNNQFLGSPVNRVRIMGMWASEAVAEEGEGGGWWGHLRFRLGVAGSDVVWWVSRGRQLVWGGGGMEEELERGMRGVAGDALGVEVGEVEGGIFGG
ncbi:hypothetical protein VE01_02620 [Pseudogymnoascus verrucosus]|uniref:ABC1 atypical kinase-like domain-containing protein n=1 Tax=Pseudogymnoascus verrucosus TaxID=342668 RepID=A0A1B8GTL3_9PEZI|nr:uncharacterized protein VE01_02620 [Pseudogymnoascus verrucosus]OBT99173.1 hypothetical protein VE01_02620 [Pseudogymnoascus verrucosus]